MSKPIVSQLRLAVVVIVAAVGGFVSSYEIGRRAGLGADLGILTTVLVLTLARRPHAFDSFRATLREFVVLAGVGIVANGVASVFTFSYPLGAVTFTFAMFLAVWLRQFDARAREAGALLMLPLVALLIVPAPHLAVASPMLRIGFAIVAGTIALVWVRSTQFVALRFRFWQPQASSEDGPLARVAVPKDRKPRLSVTTRFAMQMAVALAAAFVVGRTVFGVHAGWVVTTAFIVSIGNRGRGDVAYKSMLRIAGAVAGTLAAFALAKLAIPPGPITASVIFGALFVGTWLRRKSYAYWALAITLVLAVLQQASTNAGATTNALEWRILAILMGAICGTAASWFVMPIRTDRVVMLRLGEALAALDALLKHDERNDGDRAPLIDAFAARVERLTQVADPVEFHRRLMRAKPQAEHPANWIAIARDCARLATAHTGPTASARRANGAARKALVAIARPERVEPSEKPISLVAALGHLRESLSGGDARL